MHVSRIGIKGDRRMSKKPYITITVSDDEIQAHNDSTPPDLRGVGELMNSAPVETEDRIAYLPKEIEE